MTRNVRPERKVALQSPDYYRRHRKQLAENGIVKKVHAGSTKENIFGIKTKWTKYSIAPLEMQMQYCQYVGQDEFELLVQSTKEDIMTFLKWMLDAYPRIRKRSSLHEYWRLWRMLYRKAAGKSLYSKVIEEINDHIDGYLTRKYQLDPGAHPKPVMNVDDVFLILYHHWVLDTSLAFLLLLSAYTASRPGALVYNASNKKQREHYVGWEDDGSDDDLRDDDVGDVQTICYEDIALFLLPNPGAQRDNLVMEVALKYTKGLGKKPNP
ncbi:hypothetical protein B0J12DRAFT_702369 [Macrophomina phaseolina]|uniref:Uncharacterized protein n=1 Tax=Macrophomina phaseolina TaxID=35725 RepID=A0ABQ8G1P8_9PEZI|nr:hypothetical protein B0J12DRAFT_702369 [Macrophomina phaseolina]